MKFYFYCYGKFEFVYIFCGGSVCIDNDFDIIWNGREYYIIFLGVGLNDDFVYGECFYEFRDYFLKDGIFIFFNVMGFERWVF